MKEAFRKVKYKKCLVTIILIVWWAFLPSTGYENGDTENTYAHVAYMFSHANFWHLAGNLFVLWFIRGNMSLIPSLAIAFLVSFIPAWSLWGDVGVTMGFSGVLFAVWGIKWGSYCRRKYGLLFSACALDEFVTKALPFSLIGILVPHLNWCIHLYSLLAGYLYGRFRR